MREASAKAARELLASYLDRVDGSRAADERPDPDTPVLRRAGKRLFPRRGRLRARLATTALLAPRERRRAERLARRGPLRLHLGSGVAYKEGWVNVDLAGDRVDLAWDLTKPLPFPDASAEAIFAEHFLTLLPMRDGLSVLEECARILRPGGVLRIGVPDPWPTLSAHARELPGAEELPRLLVLQEVFYYPGNCAMYDEPTLRLMLRAAGFSTVEAKSFGESRIDPAPDTAARQKGTIYVEAVR